MTLIDRPSIPCGWEPGLPDQVLKLLGKIAIIAASIEDLLHKIYWKYCGVDEKYGPIITDNLSPKRMSEDIIKIVKKDPSKKRIFDDLNIIMKELEALNEKRNRIIHWNWPVAGSRLPKDILVTDQAPMVPSPYKITRPAYKQKGSDFEIFDETKLNQLCDDFWWLKCRLQAHSINENELRELRKRYSSKGGIEGVPFADVVLPAPWLDKLDAAEAKAQ